MASRFTVLRLLGAGGQGRVFSVADAARGNQVVALKEASPELKADLVREFGLLSRLKHPHLVSVYDFFASSPLAESGDENRAAYTQEFVDGQDLWSVCRAASPEERVLLFEQVFSALSYLHALEVVHCDLKPENVIVEAGDGLHARLLDFGIARLGSLGPEGIRGSRSYIAPELLYGEQATPQADLYALGVMMAEVWIGETPSPVDLGGKLRDPAARADYLRHRGLPESWLPVVNAMLASSPNARPTSIAEAANLWSQGLNRPIVLHTPLTIAAMLRTGPILGRDAELEKAYTRLAERQAVVVTGASGVGKSTMVRALSRQLQVEGRIVEHLAESSEHVTTSNLVGTLSRLLDAPIEWRPIGNTDSLEHGSRAEELSVRFNEWIDEEAGRLVAQLPELHPETIRPVIVLDDADTTSPLVRRLAEHFVRLSEESKLPFDFILTGTSFEAKHAIELRPLDRQAAQELVASRLGHSAASERLGAALAVASGGNPSTIENLLALLVEREDLRYVGGSWQFAGDPGHLELPASATEALKERVERLDERSREHLGAVAWLRFGGSVPEIEAALGHRASRLTLAELDAAGLLWRGADGRFAVGHPRVVEACRDWAPNDGEARAHERVLELADLDDLIRAWHVGGAEGATRAAQVAEESWRKGQLEEAARAVRVALDCESQLATALRLGAGIANLLGPRQWQVDCLDRLLGTADLPDEERLTISADLLWALTRIGDVARAEEVGQELLALATEAGASEVHANALVHLANTQIQRGDYRAGRARLLEALKEAEGPALSARIANNLGNVEAYGGNSAEALSRYTQAYDLKVAEGDPIGTRIALGNMGLMCLELGRFQEALNHFAKSRVAAVETGHRRGEAWSLLALSVLGLRAGAFDYARRRSLSALEMAEELGDQVIAWDAAGTLVEIALERGDKEEALERSATSLDRAQDVDSAYNLLGAKSVRALALLEEAPEQARRLAREVLDDEGLKDATIRAHAVRVVAEVSVATGDLDQAIAAVRTALGEELSRLTPRSLMTMESVARFVSEPKLIGRIRDHIRLCLEDGLQWPAVPLGDGVDEQSEQDGPSRKTFERQEAVKSLRRSLESQETETMVETLRRDFDAGWARRLANATSDDLNRCLQSYLAEVVQNNGAERGFVLKADGDLLASSDADGEAVSGAAGKVPSAVVDLVLSSGKAFRADSSTEARGAVCALPAMALGEISGVLVLQNRFVHTAFSDVATGDDGDDFLGLILRLRELCADLESAVAAAKDAAVGRRAEQTRSTEEILRLRKELESTRELLNPVNEYKGILFKSSVMRKMLRRLDKVIDSSLPVYVQGESGSGKELVALAIHAHGPRAEGPFIAQNCSAIPSTLFESEFFGHEKGAFTGADRANEGLFRRANGGTLFMDEIGDLPLDLQSKLLRVLETGEVRAVGGQKSHKVDVRIICATHRDLAKLVETKEFREDLFYRLNVVQVDVPPLRDRPDDIPLLVAHFLEANRAPGAELPQLDSGVMKALIRYSWPGNVRQLENEVIRASLLGDGEKITRDDLSPEVLARGRAPRRNAGASMEDLPFNHGTLKERVDELEAYVLRRSLEAHKGNKSQVARELGLSRAGLNMKLKRLDLW